MARDAITRLDDVDKDSLKLDTQAGTITFQPKKGRSLDPDRILQAIKATSFHSRLNYLEITVVGEIVGGERQTRLKVTGTTQEFLLGDDPSTPPKEGEITPFQRLRQALASRRRVVSVTGRVYGWGGDLRRRRGAQPEAGPSGPAKPDGSDEKTIPLLVVTGFHTDEMERPRNAP